MSMCWFKTNVKHLIYELTSHFVIVVEFFEDDPNGWMSRATANLNIGFRIMANDSQVSIGPRGLHGRWKYQMLRIYLVEKIEQNY
jgi:hypothetical protein